MRAETTISDETDQKLTVICERTNVTRRELIRRAIDSYCDQQYMLTEMFKMGQSLIESQAAQMEQINRNRIAAVGAIQETQQACIESTTRNHAILQQVANRLTAIERCLGIPSFSVVDTVKKVANAACIIGTSTMLYFAAPALWIEFNTVL